jgi:hypothetical protein
MSTDLTSVPAVVAEDEAVTGEEIVPAEAAIEADKAGTTQSVPEASVEVVEPGTQQISLENGHKRIEGNPNDSQQTGEEHMSITSTDTVTASDEAAKMAAMFVQLQEENKKMALQLASMTGQLQTQAQAQAPQVQAPQAPTQVTLGDVWGGLNTINNKLDGAGTTLGKFTEIEKKIDGIVADYSRVDTTRVFVKSGFAIAGSIGGYMAIDAMMPGAPTALLVGGALVGAGVGVQVGGLAADIYQVAGQKKDKK